MKLRAKRATFLSKNTYNQKIVFQKNSFFHGEVIGKPYKNFKKCRLFKNPSFSSPQQVPKVNFFKSIDIFKKLF